MKSEGRSSCWKFENYVIYTLFSLECVTPFFFCLFVLKITFFIRLNSEDYTKGFPENKEIILSEFWTCDNVQVTLCENIEKLFDTNVHNVSVQSPEGPKGLQCFSLSHELIITLVISTPHPSFINYTALIGIHWFYMCTNNPSYCERAAVFEYGWRAPRWCFVCIIMETRAKLIER